MTKELVLTESREGKRACSAWWSELLQVDFRHALWPWLLYCALLFVDPPGGEWFSIPVLLALVLTQAAVIVRVFGVDFDQGTMGRFMSFPVGRGRTWAVKIVLGSLLIFLPPVGIITTLYPLYDINLPVIILTYGFVTPGVGSLMVLMLKRIMLAWSVTILTPFAVVIILSAVLGLLGIEIDTTITGTFPYASPQFLLPYLVCGGVALVLSWRTWQRLEVVS